MKNHNFLVPFTGIVLGLLVLIGCGDDDPTTPPPTVPEPAPMVFVSIPPASVSMPATFTMGSLVEENETPHNVTLTSRFLMASTEVTNAQYVDALQWALDHDPPLVVATNASVRDTLDGANDLLLDLEDYDCQIKFNDGVFSTTDPDRPVVEVSWYGSVAYCDWLSLRDGLPRAYDHSTWSCNGGNPYEASGYRLPTEAEWEFACRAGTTTHFNTGDCLDAGTEANYNGHYPYTDCPTGSYLGRTADVGSYLSNEWGLFDMHGNIFEWCNDRYSSYNGDETDPKGPETGCVRVVRSGLWTFRVDYCRSAFRDLDGPADMSFCLGFRPARSVSTE